MFQVTVKRKFRAGHALFSDRGEKEDPHRHDWHAAVTVETPNLDNMGCAVDFREIDKIIDDVLSPLAGRTVNELAEFQNISPSAENIAVYIYKKMSPVLNDNKIRLISVEVGEDDEHYITFRRA